MVKASEVMAGVSKSKQLLYYQSTALCTTVCCYKYTHSLYLIGTYFATYVHSSGEFT